MIKHIYASCIMGGCSGKGRQSKLLFGMIEKVLEILTNQTNDDPCQFGYSSENVSNNNTKNIFVRVQ